MALARGDRVLLDFDDDKGSRDGSGSTRPTPSAMPFIRDIAERPASHVKPPTAPTLKDNATGFPSHKNRIRTSRFKQQRDFTSAQSKSGLDRSPAAFTNNHLNATADLSDSGKATSFEAADMRQIDEENRQRIAEMTPEERSQEREELLAGLPASLLEKLLKRANLNDGSNEGDTRGESLPLGQTNPTVKDTGAKLSKPSNQAKKVTFESPELPPEPTGEDLVGVEDSSGATPSTADVPHPTSLHFPKPPQPPMLDPSSDTFLEDLHDKYFPDFPTNPSALSWMSPIPSDDPRSPYHPSQRSLPASALRFDFTGALIPPSKARVLPVTKGLHHHADAPEAAGYTIPEMARLARSAVPGQRCVAYLTLGRILYRLGKGDFGVEDDPVSTDLPEKLYGAIVSRPSHGKTQEIDEDQSEGGASEMASGLWDCVKDGGVLESLSEEANKERGHASAKAYAQEALWNWRRGGGRKRRAI